MAVAELPIFEFPTNFLLTDRWNRRHLGFLALSYVQAGSRKNTRQKNSVDSVFFF